MKKISFLLASAILLIHTNASAINLVVSNSKSKWASTADAICSGFVVLGITLVVVFGTKSIINTFKNKQSDI
jgi:hypothetical protein